MPPAALPVISGARRRNWRWTNCSTVDGLLFTGSPSNVEPHHYRGEPSRPGTLHDPQRDATTLPLIPRAVAAGVPVFGICRGFQEMNVAFGGTLWQQLHEVPGHHRSPRGHDQPLERAVRAGARGDAGARRRCCSASPAAPSRITVNSLHTRACATLGPGLAVEARADGRRHRGVPRARRAALCAGGAVAPGMAGRWRIRFPRRCSPNSARALPRTG